jgi:hypothetical protein
LRVGADIVTPWVADGHCTVKIYRFFAKCQSDAKISATRQPAGSVANPQGAFS